MLLRPGGLFPEGGSKETGNLEKVSASTRGLEKETIFDI